MSTRTVFDHTEHISDEKASITPISKTVNIQFYDGDITVLDLDANIHVIHRTGTYDVPDGTYVGQTMYVFISSPSDTMNAFRVQDVSSMIGDRFVATDDNGNTLQLWDGSRYTEIMTGVYWSFFMLPRAGKDGFFYFAAAGSNFGLPNRYRLARVHPITMEISPLPITFNMTHPNMDTFGYDVDSDGNAYVFINELPQLPGTQFSSPSQTTHILIYVKAHDSWKIITTGIHCNRICAGPPGTFAIAFNNAITQTIGGVACTRVAMCTNALDDSAREWINLGGGLNNGVQHFEFAEDGRLYVVGTFTSSQAPSSVAMSRVGMWKDGAWNPLQAGLSNVTIQMIKTKGNDLYVSSNSASIVNGLSTQQFAKWDAQTQTWSDAGKNTPSETSTFTVKEDGSIVTFDRPALVSLWETIIRGKFAKSAFSNNFIANAIVVESPVIKMLWDGKQWNQRDGFTTNSSYWNTLSQYIKHVFTVAERGEIPL